MSYASTHRDELAQIKARAEAATRGPWRTGGSGVVADREYVAMGVRTDPDAEFIAHARTDIPKLVAALVVVLEMTSNPGNVVGWRGAPDNLANFADAIQSAIAEATL